MFGLRLPEILLIVGILVLLFGATRLPALGSSIGSAIRNFKRGFAGEDQPETPVEDPNKKLSQGQGSPGGSAVNQGEKAKS